MRKKPADIFAISPRRNAARLRPRSVVHIACDGAIEIDRCKGILLYRENRICLDMGALCVEIEGDSLVMDTYQKDHITIHGRVFCVKFCYQKARVKP